MKEKTRFAYYKKYARLRPTQYIYILLTTGLACRPHPVNLALVHMQMRFGKLQSSGEKANKKRNVR